MDILKLKWCLKFVDSVLLGNAPHNENPKLVSGRLNFLSFEIQIYFCSPEVKAAGLTILDTHMFPLAGQAAAKGGGF